jgi:SOS-response transcriptional repressor LexA
LKTNYLASTLIFSGVSELDKQIAERIRQARDLAHLSQVALAQACGVHAVTISKWETGVQTPEKHYEKISVACGVNLAWLIRGEGKPRVGRTATVVQPMTFGDLVKKLDDQAASLEATRKELESLRSTEIEHRELPQMQELPVVGRIAADHVPTFAESKETQLVDVRYSRDRHYCLQVKGRSMHPSIYEGDIVVVEHVQMALEPYDEMKGPADKQCWKALHKHIVCAIVDDEDPIIKRVRITDRKDTGFKIVLAGDNPAAETVEVNKDSRLRICGIIRKIMRDPLNFD